MNLSMGELRAIQQDIGNAGRADWTHLPGPSRAIDIDQCLGGGVNVVDLAPAGFPSGYGMQPCGCWGPNPAEVSPDVRCSSGSVRVNVCPNMCAPGHPAYARVCN